MDTLHSPFLKGKIPLTFKKGQYVINPKDTYDTLYIQAGTWRQNTEKYIFIVTNKFWVPNLSFLKA